MTDSNTNKIDVRELMENALKEAQQMKETPLMQLLRKVLNEEREFLYSESKFNQRRRKIKEYIEEAREAGQVLESIGE